MRLKHLLVIILIALPVLSRMAVAQDRPFGISLPPSLNFAASPNPVGSGARAQGQGLAFIGMADDATAASHNPGGLFQLNAPEASIVGSYDVRFEQQMVTQPDTLINDQTLHHVTLNYFSVAYPFKSFNRNWVISLNIQRLYDLRGETEVTSPFRNIDGIQQVRSTQDGGLFTISPAISGQLHNRLGVGIAFNIWPDLWGNGWSQDVTVRGEGFVASDTNILRFTSNGEIREEYRFRGFNITAGFLWKIKVQPEIRLGGVFRSPFTAKVKHEHTSTLSVRLSDGTVVEQEAPFTFRETLDMELPLSYGLGLSIQWRGNDRVLGLALDVSRIHWSDFRLETSSRADVLEVENGAPSGKGRAVLNGEADDTTSVRIGFRYRWLERDLKLRAGAFYDPEPGRNGVDHFYGFSLGTGFKIKSLLFDIAYTFRAGEVQSEATDTTVYQHNVLASMIYHL